MAQELRWLRSRYCADHTCVEVARNDEGQILVRNSAAPDMVIRFAESQWRDFLTGVSEGRFPA
jgi:hypothetical protein